MDRLPGFRDFLPADCAARNYIFWHWRRTAEKYGFAEWDGPILEPTELYKKKSGDEIVEQLFHFVDKGERDVSLRPELTPSLARVIAAHDREFKKPLKWFSIGQFFRYEKQQRGRLREHYQLNCDIIGEESVAADIELVALVIDVLRDFSLWQTDFVVRISDREFWTDFLRTQSVPENHWQGVLQIIDKSEREPREKTAQKLGKLAEPVFRVLQEGGKSARLDELVAGLRTRQLDEFVKIDMSVVRGLAYYTGIVFEVFDPLGRFRAIAGGGRYDNLIGQLSDSTVSLPALGFAMGDVVLGEVIRNNETAYRQMTTFGQGAKKTLIYIVIAKEERRSDAILYAQKMRDIGWRIDYPLTPTKVARQFQAAEEIGANAAILFGDEWPNLRVKRLATREEVLIPKDELVAKVPDLLGFSKVAVGYQERKNVPHP